ncbi:formate dehydrogenase subunit gamma [Noviherbaspirillum sp. DKR-6]|uniref:Formate dehydrogenase subunit gamma n=2 Tax=Noviherbaspirillum pedocola TaxID=2801341 RepID=A0A934SUQ2_9BURK|nr:formate dehydrogenase subunit gamma [Noviherbaspirillum pedocola]
MNRPLAFAAVLLCLLLGIVSGAHAAVPNHSAVPAYAEEQTILQTEQAVPEPGYGDKDSGKRHIDRHFIQPFGYQSESDVLLQRGGNTWRTLRNGPLATIAGAILLLALLAIFLMYRLIGPAPMDPAPSGRKIRRFSAWDRMVHWVTAISFIVLALTGLIILYGKKLLLPWMGHGAFSAIAMLGKYLHNFIGPFFIFCTAVMFLTFLRANFWSRIDWLWIRRAGGLVNHQPVPAGFFNAGEKLWFWGGVSFLGLIVSVSGLLLDFVNFGQTRYVLQWANYLHLGAAVFYIAFSMGHIYIGTLGTPGAYEAMRRGTVDEEWARTHHSLWYDDVRAGRVTERGERSAQPSQTIARGDANA